MQKSFDFISFKRKSLVEFQDIKKPKLIFKSVLYSKNKNKNKIIETLKDESVSQKQ